MNNKSVGTGPEKTRPLDLDVEVDFGFGDGPRHRLKGPRALLIDRYKRFYLAEIDEHLDDESEDPVCEVILARGRRRPIDQVREGELRTITVRRALQWYARRAVDIESSGLPDRLCAVAAKLLPT